MICIRICFGIASILMKYSIIHSSFYALRNIRRWTGIVNGYRLLRQVWMLPYVTSIQSILKLRGGIIHIHILWTTYSPRTYMMYICFVMCNVRMLIAYVVTT